MAVVRYLVSDVERSISFYTSYLGFTLAEQMGPAKLIVAFSSQLSAFSSPIIDAWMTNKRWNNGNDFPLHQKLMVDGSFD